jgi:hypothetical protein
MKGMERMQDTTQVRRNQRQQSQSPDQDISQEDERFLATIPGRTTVERYGAGSPPPEVYRQAVRAILATPELEGRLNYATASLIVTVFGSWLAARMLASRAFLLFVDGLLFLTSLAVAGFLVGGMIGENILPVETIPVLLFAALAIVLLMAGCVLGNMLVNGTRHTRSASRAKSSDLRTPAGRRKAMT